MNKQEIEKAINGLEQLKPLLQALLIQVNNDGLGKEDAREIGEHFDIALWCMEQQLTGGWIPTTGFTVIDTETGQYPDMCNIARREEWSENLIYCEIEGFAITEDGYLIAFDECGNMAYCPEDRFKIISEPYKEDKDE